MLNGEKLLSRQVGYRALLPFVAHGATSRVSGPDSFFLLTFLCVCRGFARAEDRGGRRRDALHLCPVEH